MTTPQQHYKVTEVAEMLSVSREQVHQLISDGSLAAINVGRHAKKYWRVSQTDLDAFLASQRAKNTYAGKSA